MAYGPYEALKVLASERFSRIGKYMQTYAKKHPGIGMQDEMFLKQSLFPVILQQGYKLFADRHVCFERVRADESIWLEKVCGQQNNTVVQYTIEQLLGRTCKLDRSLLNAEGLEELKCNVCELVYPWYPFHIFLTTSILHPLYSRHINNSLTREPDLYLNKAQKQEAWLLRKLEPQWQARDQAKQKMGPDRWANNPRPKNNFAAVRKQHEQELQQVQHALQYLRNMNVDETMQSTKALQEKLGVSHSSHASESQRYNGKRPLDTYQDRVSWDDYPDPTEFGWEFTGSVEASRVEFFELNFEQHGLVKLDFYYTTGAMKTSLEHPVHGKTQLFASGDHVDAETHIQILLDPRAHTTGKRYQKKSNKPKANPVPTTSLTMLP